MSNAPSLGKVRHLAPLGTTQNSPNYTQNIFVATQKIMIYFNAKNSGN